MPPSSHRPQHASMAYRGATNRQLYPRALELPAFNPLGILMTKFHSDTITGRYWILDPDLAREGNWKPDTVFTTYADRTDDRCDFNQFPGKALVYIDQQAWAYVDSVQPQPPVYVLFLFAWNEERMVRTGKRLTLSWPLKVSTVGPWCRVEFAGWPQLLMLAHAWHSCADRAAFWRKYVAMDGAFSIHMSGDDILELVREFGRP
ncbi:hypothetical protein Q8F55_006837 [Vanrija albida]|uniref:Uncharacterized protein n=1 Tax=Vanrija albida TaxID=181172 RepID=A0ABR3PYC3_9TREE